MIYTGTNLDLEMNVAELFCGENAFLAKPDEGVEGLVRGKLVDKVKTSPPYGYDAFTNLGIFPLKNEPARTPKN
jgi:hypothetical protein